MPDPTAREALEDFRKWLVETCDHIRHAGELLVPTHGPGDLMLFERSNGLRLAIDEIEQRIATLKDSKSAGAYDANGNPRTTPVRMKLQARHIHEEQLVDVRMVTSPDEVDGPVRATMERFQQNPPPSTVVKPSAKSIDYRKYISRVCRTLHHCEVCGEDITAGHMYFDGGHGRRAHDACGARQDGVWDVGNDPHPPLDDTNPESEEP